MSQKVQILRASVEQRLTTAAQEIFGLFERTIAEYEEELCRTKEENQRQRQILDCVWNPRVLIHKTDVQQLLVVKEEVPPEQQEWNPIVDQEEQEPEPEPPHIKEELWTIQEVNITKFPSTPVPVKSEDDDEEKVKSSQLKHTPTEENKVEENKVGCGGSEPSSSFHLHRHLQTETAEQNEDSEETEDSDEDQTLNHKPESKLQTNSSTEQMKTETDGDDSGGSEPDIILVHMESIKGRTVDMMTNNDLTPSDVGYVKKLYHCSVCSKPFCWKSKLEIHMMSHTGEKPFRCSLCHKSFRDRSNMRRHMTVHTGDGLFYCSFCGKSFTCNSHLTVHMRIHTSEKPFSCSECGKTFGQKRSLERHRRLHSGEKPFRCGVCQKRFKRKYHVHRHMNIHRKAEYKEKLCRTKEENQRQRQILDPVWNPRVLIHKTDVQQLLVVKEEVPPEQQEWNSIVDQEEPEPEPPHIKEEQKELWTIQEVNITKFPSTPVPVKSEDDDEEKVKCSEFNNLEVNKVGCGGPEPSSSFHLHRHLQTNTDEQNEDSEETEDSDEYQTLNHKPESKLQTNSSTEQMKTETDGDDGGGSEPDIILVHMESIKGRTVDSKSLLEEHMDTHTGQKLVGSSECEATFSQKKTTTKETNSPTDMMMNTDWTQSDVGCEKKLYHCSVCTKTFSQKSHLERHMRIHTGEKPFSCSECGKRFTRKTGLEGHMRLHTGDTPFSCVVCQKHFTCKDHLQIHEDPHERMDRMSH